MHIKRKWKLNIKARLIVEIQNEVEECGFLYSAKETI
jgi:hypothetical protein